MAINGGVAVRDRCVLETFNGGRSWEENEEKSKKSKSGYAFIPINKEVYISCKDLADVRSFQKLSQLEKTPCN